MASVANGLIHDWNTADGRPEPPRGRVELDDETLRDGLQSPSVRTPTVAQKVELLHGLVELGIDAADIGLPGAGPHVARDAERLAREIVTARLPIVPNCAARTVRADIEPIVEIAQRVGIALEVACFLGSSPIRQYAEGWDLDRMRRLTEEAVGFAVAAGLPVMYVTEDTTRAAPGDLAALYRTAVQMGARRVCIADTVGYATPEGAASVVRFVRGIVDATGEEVAVDWHGHNDRGLGVGNAIAAALAGADRIHGTLLGIGERVGNTPIDQLLVNFHLMGWRDHDLSGLADLCTAVAGITGIPIPDNYPVLGRDAFRTQSGVHAAAILKAKAKGDNELADRVYSGIPASLVGRRQEVEIGPMSGQANVHYWLASRGLPATPELVSEICRRAKESRRVLSEAEVLACCRRPER